MSRQRRRVVSDEQELEIRRMCSTLMERALGGSVDWDHAKPIVQTLIEGSAVEGVAPGVQPGTKKRDLAEEYRQRFEDWYRPCGAVTIPRTNFSNRAIAKRHASGQDLFFYPATSVVSYEAFMASVGQGNHWTVTDAAERAKIGWEPTATGYWFWADVQDDCPRLGTTRDGLIRAIKLLSLEEYIIVWHATKAMSGRILDVRTRCWLRTPFGPGALDADGFAGRVGVAGNPAENLSIPSGYVGGRALDVVG